jgi:hypothetical protein
MRAITALAAVLILACPAALAQPRKASPPVEPSMEVHIVRSADPKCEPDCPQWIAAQGRIVPGTAAKFRKVLRQLGKRKLPVLIDSGGGAVNDALAIGRLMRSNELTVAVTRTAFEPCAPKDAACRKAKTGGELRGRAQGFLSKCASSCAFILAGGTERLVGRGTGVGVHQISMTLLRYQVWTRRSFGMPVETKRTLVSREKVGSSHAEAQSTYARIGKFFSEMGIRDHIMTLIMQTPNDSIRWLNPNELQWTRIATKLMTGEDLIAGVEPPSVPTSTVPRMLPPMPTTQPMPPPPAGAPDSMKYRFLCAQYGVCPPGAPMETPKFESTGPLLSPHMPKPSSSPGQPAQASETEKRP